MHHASPARIPPVALIDCWTGLAPLVGCATQPNPQPARPTPPRAAVPGRLRRLLRLIA